MRERSSVDAFSADEVGPPANPAALLPPAVVLAGVDVVLSAAVDLADAELEMEGGTGVEERTSSRAASCTA